ncbi:MAG: tetratricopeptide repeat protein, partial [Nannocystaceae bacterium]
MRSARLLTLLSLVLAGTPACKEKPTNTPGSDGAAPTDTTGQDVAKAKSQALVDLANEKLRAGKYQAAREMAEDALKKDDNNADAHAVLGAASFRAGDIEASNAGYKEALEIEPKNFGALLGMARNLQAVGDHKGAIELCDRALAQDAKQIDPMMYKMWSYYAQTDMDSAVKEFDNLFKFIDGKDPLLPILQAQAAYARALEGKGPLIEFVGATGSSDAQLDPNGGFKHAGGLVGSEFTRVVFFEVREEARIHTELAATLQLKPIGKVKPAGSDAEVDIVLIPEVKFGDLTVKNVPALVEDLSPYGSIGEVPGMLMGRQVMQKFGSITFDYPQGSSTFTAAPLGGPPAGAVEAPLYLIDMRILTVPVTRISLDGSDYSFFAWFGGVFYKSAISITKRAFIKSGHRPSELDPLDDADQGLKMFYVHDLKVGEFETKGVGGLVMAGTPPNAELGQLVANTGFEIGGYVNPTVLKNL